MTTLILEFEKNSYRFNYFCINDHWPYTKNDYDVKYYEATQYDANDTSV